MRFSKNRKLLIFTNSVFKMLRKNFKSKNKKIKRNNKKKNF